MVMNVELPKSIEKKIQKRAKKYGVSEQEYVQKVVEHALSDDEALDEEMRAWDEISLRDFRTFSKTHNI